MLCVAYSLAVTILFNTHPLAPETPVTVPHLNQTHLYDIVVDSETAIEYTYLPEIDIIITSAMSSASTERYTLFGRTPQVIPHNVWVAALFGQETTFSFRLPPAPIE